MGMLSQAELAVKQLEGKNPQKTGVSDTSATTDKLLEKFPDALREKALSQGVRAAARPVVTAYRKNIKKHRSRETGTRKGWSKKVAEKRAKQTDDLYRSAGVKVKQYKQSGSVLAMAGPRKPAGSHGHLLEFGATIELWGTGKTVRLPPGGQLRDAAQSTMTQQEERLIKKVKQLQEKV